MARRRFRGVINTDVRDSVPDWTPYLPPEAKAGSPNILYIVVDDTGIAAWDCFGGLIEMPNVSRLAKAGIRFTNWHTTALCSPTRSCLLTGRNATSNGMACITECANGFPSTCGVIPRENGMLSEILRDVGYSTICLGKWHLTPSNELASSSSKRTWPLGRGFDRFYGFLGAETNQWYPDLVLDNGPIEQPRSPKEGYHLSTDLADRAIQLISEATVADEEKPWLCYLAFGANHAPHQVPRPWIEKYRGKFDMGYEKYRELVLANMKKLGVVPESTELSPPNPWAAPSVIAEADLVRPWDSLNADEKRLFCRMAEVYAGFASHMDHEIGRVLDHLEASEQLENTIVIVCSDNGASGEGTPNGSVNENKFANGYPESLEQNLAMIDRLGSEDSYGHYPTGWAWAFNAPYKMFKRFSLEGGTEDPLIMAWPKGWKKQAGQLRDQYFHAIDLVPTLLEACGVEEPERIDGIPQRPIEGMSMVPVIEDRTSTRDRKTQFYAMLGTRAIYHDGWKAVARHGPLTGHGKFEEDVWELYHLRADRTECHDVAAEHPTKLSELIGLWWSEAGRYDALPLDDRTGLEIVTQKTLVAPKDRWVLYPGTGEIPEEVAPIIRGRSFVIGASLREVRKECEGVIVGQGSRFGGYSLYVQNGKLVYVYNFLGIEQFRFEADMPTGRVTCSVAFTKKSESPKFVPNGTLEMRINKKVVASGPMRTQPGRFALAGEGLHVGRDGGDTVTTDYEAPFPLRGAILELVSFDMSGKPILDLQRELATYLARD